MTGADTTQLKSSSAQSILPSSPIEGHTKNTSCKKDRISEYISGDLHCDHFQVLPYCVPPS